MAFALSTDIACSSLRLAELALDRKFVEINTSASGQHPKPVLRGPVEGPNTKGLQRSSTQPENVRGASIPWRLPDVKVLRKEFVDTYSLETKEEALKRTANVVRKYSDEMVKRWNEEIDTLLVYAGLFSAILTAFNVQSYVLLQPANPDPILLVLRQMSLQLNSFSVHPHDALINSTHLVDYPAFQASPVEPWAVWLNSLWFSALICSLASASIGILVKQWVHEYQAGISGDSLEIARLRQYRLNHLEKWHVAEIVAFLPVLLQISLFLFFSGLLVLLWHYHSTVAIVASILIAAVTLFVAVTTVMPMIWDDCCYLSPPIYPLFTFVQHVKRSVIKLCNLIFRLVGLIQVLIRNTPDAASKIPWDLADTLSTWRGREQNAVQAASSKLDIEMMVHAYSITIDIQHLSDTGAILAPQGADAIRTYYDKVKAINEQHFGERGILIFPPEFWAVQMIHSEKRAGVDNLIASGSYRDGLSSATYIRKHPLLSSHQPLLLSAVATIAAT